MIYILTTPVGRITVDAYLSLKGVRDRDILQTLTYSQACRPRLDPPPPGVYIFADVERLSPSQEEAAKGFWNRLQGDSSNYLTLNRPGLTLRRTELLRRLWEEGINRHRAWPVLGEMPPDARYPLFLRIANDHDGARSSLLNDPSEFKREVEGLRSRGVNLKGWIACEYVGWRRPDGAFGKYAAFIIAGKVIPRGVLFSRHWQVKAAELFDEDLLREERAYVEGNPHKDILSRIFNLAGVEYGRVDYSLDADGKLSVWEINTNPHIYSLALAVSPHRGELNQAWADQFSGQMRALSARVSHQTREVSFRQRVRWGIYRLLAPRFGASHPERYLRMKFSALNNRIL